MTTEAARSAPRQRLGETRRQQLVSAAVVGTVVVILGFASGIGVDAASTSASAPQAAPSTSPAPLPTQTTRPPVHYIGVPEPAQPVVITVVPSAPAVSSETPPTTPASSPTTTTPPVPVTCPGDLLSGLLTSVLNILGGGVGAPTNLLGGVTSLLGLAGPLTAPAIPAAPSVPDLVPGLLAQASPSASPAVTTACTNAVLGTLPLLGGLR